CHTDDLARAAAAFPELNFFAFHSAFPWEAELADHAKAAKVKNIYAELGSLARMMRSDPARYAVLIGTLLNGFGADYILWGTDRLGQRDDCGVRRRPRRLFLPPQLFRRQERGDPWRQLLGDRRPAGT